MRHTFAATGIVDIHVEGRAEGSELVIRDGFPCGQRETRLPRITDVDRIVICSRHGRLTLDATQWMAEVGIGWQQVVYGDPIAYGAKRGLDAVLLRAQARMQETSTGIEITRYLLDQKLEGQALNLWDMHAEQLEFVKTCRESLPAQNSLESLRDIEAKAAKAYWLAWSDIPMQFTRSHKVLPHWCTFDSRTSAISGGKRNASNPFNAMLNFGYGCLENETSLVIHRMGLDPALGILHKDTKYRRSFACDLMEPARPMMDKIIRQWVDNHCFDAKQFVETKDGTVRIGEELTQRIAVMVRDDVVPLVYTTWEHVLNMIVQDMARGDKRERSPLTNNNGKKRWLKKVAS